MYVTFRSICSECGEVYASRKIKQVFKDPHDPRYRALKRDGFVSSYGYCPECLKAAKQELRLVARRMVNFHV